MTTIDEVLTRGVSDILPSKEGLKKLMDSKKIRIYQGFDPSMPSLHLGNFVGLMKLRQFQKLGHEVIFLVGDFTGMIGDPTDKGSTRKQLTRDEVVANSKTWKEQASKVLDFEGDNPAKIMFNSEWSDKVSFKDLIEISSHFTVQQMIERDMFQERLKANKPIYLHEFLYPVAQGYDCVSMDVDLEIGGSDQIFNMMAGRDLMKSMRGKEKFVLGTKLLVDKDGKKAGKTTGNALFLDSTPQSFYSGIMSFPDSVLKDSFELLTELPLEDVDGLIKEDPMKAKKKLAFEITKFLWGEEKAKDAEVHFQKTFQDKMPTFDIKVSSGSSIASTIAPFTPNASISEAKRLVSQGAVDVNGSKVTDHSVLVRVGDEIKVGKTTFLKATK